MIPKGVLSVVVKLGLRVCATIASRCRGPPVRSFAQPALPREGYPNGRNAGEPAKMADACTLGDKLHQEGLRRDTREAVPQRVGADGKGPVVERAPEIRKTPKR